MSFRRSPEQTRAESGWAGFVAANRARLQAAGLPLFATQSVAHWDDLLMHGHFAHHEDPSHFSISNLSADQYTVFVDVVESYFLGGYEYFAPTALKVEDQVRLTSRFSA
jgi:hypothetical protein